MAATGDSWLREYKEACRLSDDINNMISERSSLPASGPEAQRHSSAIRRKITILGTRLDSLQSLLAKLHGKQSLTEKEMNRRQDMVTNLSSKVTQMASTLNMSNFANRDSLLGPEKKPADVMSRITGLDNQGVVGLQRQVMKEQDEGLEKLEETIISTKHIALAVNEELDLHTRLIDNLDEHVEVTDSRLQRVQKRLAILNKRTKGGCSCMCLLLSVLGIVGLITVRRVVIELEKSLIYPPLGCPRIEKISWDILLCFQFLTRVPTGATFLPCKGWGIQFKFSSTMRNFTIYVGLFVQLVYLRIGT
ncbi:syntaxin of plants 51 [Perilla frutescens var. frutescens]|nr:syntaxin of plants 51 [Perilla frutescens var. frutescens]